MCGIVGYFGNENAEQLLPDCLKRLDYRGYDSFGFAFADAGNMAVIKEVGRVGDFSAKESGIETASIGIGHSRWATHGAVTKDNAHPHLSCDGSIAIVHNGIIENHLELRKMLSSKGHCFAGETDSEVIAHLAEQFMADGKTFRQAVRETCKGLKGTFAILFLHRSKNCIAAARKGSPLIIGLGEDGKFIASDATAFIPFTKNAIFLEDKELAFVGENIEVENFRTGDAVEKESIELDMKSEQVEKQGFSHFMLKEIFEQPAAFERCLTGRLYNGKVVLEELKPFEEKFRNIERIIFLGCGTSWHASLIASYLVEGLCEIPARAEYAAEFRYREPVVNENCLVIVVSQSGETADTLAALREAKKRGAFVLGLCNVECSTIARESDAVVFTRAGPEIGVASTKAFTTQLALLSVFSIYLASLKGKLGIREEKFVKELRVLSSKMRLSLEQAEAVKDVAEKYWEKENALYLGRGLNYPIALEGALKLKEISYLHAEGMPAAEMKHGPIALVDMEMPVIFIAVKDPTYRKVLSNIEEVKARAGKVIAVAVEGDNEIKDFADSVIYVAETIPLFQPLLTVLPLQLLAYYIAEKRGCDIDKPRNLAKSVTVE